MRRHFLIGSVILAMTSPAIAAPWARGFVVDSYEPAFYYGGKPGGTDAPGTDCPKGTIPENDYAAILATKWRTAAEIAPLVRKDGDQNNSEEARATYVALELASSYRGFRRDIETFINPFAAPDPGMREVSGKIAEGFNLDGDAKTGRFTGPNGERGIDNAFYRAWGCLMSWRGTAYHAYLSMRATDKMLDGLDTLVIRVSGNKSPMNDDDATVEIGYSPDHPIKAADGSVVSDYSYRIAKGAQYTKLKAHIRNGVVETEQVPELRAPDFAYFAANTGEALFYKGKLRLVVGADGSFQGLLGGYRDWREMYAKDAFNQGSYIPTSATTRETTYFQNEIGMYYALKRNADGMPDAKGHNTAISIAYRIKGRPAYVVDPQVPVGITPLPASEKRGKAVAELERAMFKQAEATKAIVDTRKLLRKDSGYDGESSAPEPKRPAKGELQVDNGKPAALADSR